MKRFAVCTLLLGLSSVLFGQNYNISTVAGSVAAANGDNVNAGLAALVNPTAVVLDSAGNIYIADGDGYRVRKIDATTGNTTVIVGQGRASTRVPRSTQPKAVSARVLSKAPGNVKAARSRWSSAWLSTASVNSRSSALSGPCGDVRYR